MHNSKGGAKKSIFFVSHIFFRECRIFLFAATPPAIAKVWLSLVNFEYRSIARIDFSIITSCIACWKLALKSHTSFSNKPPCFSVSSFRFRIKAVLRPENEKLQSSLSSKGRGKLKRFTLPFMAASSIAGPPGCCKPKRRAALSKASPGASSIVPPSLSYFL